jgi:hypothetical protein
MHWLKPTFAALLAALWLPVTSHCLLEVADFIPLDECCTAADARSGGHEADQTCQVEYAAYALPKGQKLAPEPCASAPIATFRAPAPVTPPALRLLASEDTLAPPELPARWRFTLRTAPPSRAPSSAA